jgi:hypothetical protein
VTRHTPDFVIAPVGDGTYAGYRSSDGDTVKYQPGTGAGDIGNVINYIAANQLTTGGAIGLTGDNGTTVPVVVPAGVVLVSNAWSKPGDAVKSRLRAVTGFTAGQPLVLFSGASSGALDCCFDANEIATHAVKATGNRVTFNNVAAWNGTSYAVQLLQAASDGWWVGGNILLKESITNATALSNEGGDNKFIGVHIHGVGNQSTNRIIFSDGHHAQFVGCHIEAGATGTGYDWGVETTKNRNIFSGCHFGQCNGSSGELLVSAGFATVTGCNFFDSGGLTVDSHDMIRVLSGGGLTITGCDVTYGDSHRWAHAIDIVGTAEVRAVGNRLAGKDGPWGTGLPAAESGNTWNGVRIEPPGGLASTVALPFTLTGPFSGDTAVASYTIPADTLQVGSVYRIEAWGTADTPSTGNVNFAFKLRYGPPAVVAQVSTPTATSISAKPWHVTATFLYTGTSAEAGLIDLQWKVNTTAVTIQDFGTGTASQASGVAKVLELTMGATSAPSGQNITCLGAVIEQVKSF